MSNYSYVLEHETIIRGPKGHIDIRISHSGSKAQYKGISEIMVARILCLCGLLGPNNIGTSGSSCSKTWSRGRYMSYGHYLW